LVIGQKENQVQPETKLYLDLQQDITYQVLLGQTCLAFDQKRNGVQPETKAHLDLQQIVVTEF